jgi:NADPH-dependent curcumin reductase CurA
MSVVSNSRILFNAFPKGEQVTQISSRFQILSHSTDYPVPGETLVVDNNQTIDIDNAPLNGGVLFKILALSVDPYQRGKMNQSSRYRESYKIGEP